MDEEQTTKEEEQKAPAADTKTGNKPEETDPIKLANIAAERLEKANEERSKVLRESKEFEAKRILGGQTAAGQAPEPPKETTDQDRKDYYQDVLKGKFNIKR